MGRLASRRATIKTSNRCAVSSKKRSATTCKCSPCDLRTSLLKRHSSGSVVLEEVLNHRWVRKGGGITQVTEIVLRDFAQDPAHDLARAGLGQTRRPLDNVRRSDRADLFTHPLD